MAFWEFIVLSDVGLGPLKTILEIIKKIRYQSIAFQKHFISVVKMSVWSVFLSLSEADV